MMSSVAMQTDGGERAAGQGAAMSEEQDELALPNFRKHTRGGSMPLLGQVSAAQDISSAPNQNTVYNSISLALLTPCHEAVAFGSAEAEDSGGHR